MVNQIFQFEHDRRKLSAIEFLNDLRDGQRILSRDLRATTTREGYALSRYCDYVPQLAKIAAARGGAAKDGR